MSIRNLRSRRIIIRFTQEYILDCLPERWDTKLRDLPRGSSYTGFKRYTVLLLGAAKHWETAGVDIMVCHKQLMPVPEGTTPPIFYLNQAKAAFPFLFETP